MTCTPPWSWSSGRSATPAAPGDRVLDPFGGSGTTLIAAEKSGRVARLMELDPGYVDVIVSRWQERTGKAAVRESDGVAFDELSAGTAAPDGGSPFGAEGAQEV